MPSFDAVVIGAGHAGIEAALALARMGQRTLVLTMNLDLVGQMSCNPSIGGVGKGQMAREVDALGGEMGRAADETGIQFRMLNGGKGPAVRAPRAQCDKRRYRDRMKEALERAPNLFLQQDTVEEILVERGRAAGVRTRLGLVHPARAVVVTTGTFLRGLTHTGEAKAEGGRSGEGAARGISASLERLGLALGRLKTGTPPRLLRSTIDFSRMEEQPGEEPPPRFSFHEIEIERPQLPCHLAWTNPGTHEILRKNLHRAPMYSGQIAARGPRYCPSIEDKVVRFAEKERHAVFLEPEGRGTAEIYANGISTSTPVDVQEAVVRSIAGLENAHILRYGYAVEYDYVPPHQIHPTFECRTVEGLYIAGQICGTSGYEEAAGQGILAGINAALRLRGEGPFLLGRDEAYLGVMADDLVTKTLDEPYRMFTSRAERRLHLRQDNADRRLMKYGRRFGLVPAALHAALERKEEEIRRARAVLASTRAGGTDLATILARPETRWEELAREFPGLAELRISPAAREQVEIEAKYRGFFEREEREVERFRSLEGVRIPAGLDYAAIVQLGFAAREKLALFRPSSLGQAARIAGVTPADLSVLMVRLRGFSERETRAADP